MSDHPQLRRLAWQLPATAELTPEEAWGTYERDWRHVDASAINARERALLADPARALKRRPLDV